MFAPERFAQVRKLLKEHPRAVPFSHWTIVLMS